MFKCCGEIGNATCNVVGGHGLGGQKQKKGLQATYFKITNMPFEIHFNKYMVSIYHEADPKVSLSLSHTLYLGVLDAISDTMFSKPYKLVQKNY